MDEVGHSQHEVDSARTRWRAALSVAGLALVGIAVVAVLAVAQAAVFPTGCASCHLEGAFAEQTAASEHDSITCATCHIPGDVASRVAFASRQVFSMRLGIMPDAGRAGAHVPDSTCLDCHESVLFEVTDSRGYRINHASCAEGRDCVDCHSATAHGDAVTWERVSQMSDCMECHAATRGTAECETCHEARSESERLGAGAWRVTHGPNWESAHGMGDLSSCSACHAPAVCERCHGIELPHGEDFMRQHSQRASEDPDTCAQCHLPAFCQDCHGVPMPHPDSFTAQHPAIVDADGDDVCLGCHTRADCADCHVLHVHPGLPPSFFEGRRGGL